ncbi:MAG TPA: TlpA disulfide reductase family protein [Methylomirabilota bacterium]
MRRRQFPATVLLLALAIAAATRPTLAQIDTEEDRERELARERAVQKSMSSWEYDLYRRERDRNKLKNKTELDKLVSAARLYPLVGRDPPPFTLVRPDGRRVGLSDFTGHVVLLYFWTTASPYTALEMPATIEKLQRELKDRRFTVVAVNIKDKKEDVAPWIQSRGLSPVVLLDTNGVVAEIYRVRSTPTAYLIGRDHKLVGRVMGTRGWDGGASKELIDYLLKAPIR